MSASKQPSESEQSKPIWSQYTTTIYMTGGSPSIHTYDIEKLAQKAREVTKDYHDAYMYTFGSAGSSSTDHANRKALERWHLIPRMLRDASARNLETTIFGVKYRSPIFVAPVGVQGILHADGELATARAAAQVGVPFIMSSASTRSIEAVAEANGPGAHRWYQLYWPRSDELTLSILRRAKAAGFTTLVVTLDTMVLGWRPHDLDTAYLPFAAGVGIQVGTSDPVFMASQGLPARPDERPAFPFDSPGHRALLQKGDATAKQATELGVAFLQETNSGQFKTWEDLELLRKNWDGPIVLKGIQSVDDAHKAIELGIDGIGVSNHGGRQIDGAIPSFLALEIIMASTRVKEAQKSGKLTVLFDSGIRTGSDVVKALAMGAQAVLYARPLMYGLAVSGQQGVEEVLRGILADTEITLGLSGYSSVADIQGKKEEVMIKLDA